MTARIAFVALLLAPTAALAQTVGPDAGGYAASPALLDFVDISSVGAPLGILDDSETEVALPFPFPYYGNTWTHVVVSENGGLAFTDGSGVVEVGWSNESLPAYDTDDWHGAPDIAVFWDDFNVSQGGQVYAGLDAVAGRFIIQWHTVPHYYDSGEASFQAQLYSDGAIALEYVDLDFGNSTYDWGNSATVGVQDRAGGGNASGSWLQINHDSPDMANGDAWLVEQVCGDLDGDGHQAINPLCPLADDCDDTDAAISPSGAETCGDGVDQDCNGYDQLVDMDLDGEWGPLCGGEDCADFDAGVLSTTDADGDGALACEDDCDDGEAAAFPGNAELCDGIDNDCDGTGDDLSDEDGDGVTVCGGDCDDDEATALPGGTEVCGNGLDDDCDGTTDVIDGDLDGFNDCSEDCDPLDDDVYPGATELCDGVDADCDGIEDAFDLDIGSTILWIADLESDAGGAVSTASVGLSIWEHGVPASGPPAAASGVKVWATVLLGDYGVDNNTAELTFPPQVLPIGASAFRFTYWQVNESDCAWDYTWIEVNDGSGWQQIDDGDGCFDGLEDTDGEWRTRTIPMNYYSGQTVQVRFVHSSDSSFSDYPGTYIDDVMWLAMADLDADGSVSTCGDCNDTDASVYPGAVEICDDAIDQDCLDGDLLSDVDGDFALSPECGGDDCDDSDPALNPGVDFDADGYDVCVDCADDNASINSGAVELECNGIDEDCDGVDAGGSVDLDGDGFSACDGDCNDVNLSAFPGGVEVCDGVDNDCDGLLDEVDFDGDGYTAAECGGGDCDDNVSTTHPSATEACDGVDADCDGRLDEQDFDLGGTQLWYADFEGDDGGLVASADNNGTVVWERGVPTSGPGTAFGGAEVWATVLAGDYDANSNDSYLLLAPTLVAAAGVELQFAYWQDNEDDCYFDYTYLQIDDNGTWVSLDDGDGCGSGLEDTYGEWRQVAIDLSPWAGTTVSIRFGHSSDSSVAYYPGTYLDDLRFVQGGPDLDGDGNVDACNDCDDNSSAMAATLPEICDDGIDNDCDGSDLLGDPDGDGAASAHCGGDDCDDGDGAVSPTAIEACDDGIDNDCDEGTPDVFDADGDGVDCDTDCDDANPLMFPGFVELCDGLDNDCDPATSGADRDGDGSACDNDCDDTWAGISPLSVEELCTGVDEDCDFVTTPDVADGDGDTFDCDVDCEDGNIDVFPGALELPCDGLDNDCNPATVGDPDDDLDGSTCAFDCDDDDPARSPDFAEVCADGVDNDCNPSTPDDGDADGDGFNCAADCDDAEPTTFPGAPEICDDGVDSDCDDDAGDGPGGTFEMDDDGSMTVTICSFAFPFCGTTWESFQVQANGRVTFGFDSALHTESAAALVAQTPQIAPLWTDLDPSAAGSVIVEESGGASVTITWSEIPAVGGSVNNTVALHLYIDGTADFEYGSLGITDGLAGWACGDADTIALDLSDPGLLPNQTLIGSGTEDAIYEVFSPTATPSAPANPNDLSGTTLELCLTAGSDVDEDGFTDLCGDCDDVDATRFPGNPEICDGADNDCDGTVDEVDVDADGFLDIHCGGDDCDDADAAVRPDATEECNGIDDDCSGAPETGEEDDDGDGWKLCDGDCDDTEAADNPDADEVCDGADNDCDGDTDEGFQTDIDNDGYHSALCGGDDCDDGRPRVYPGAEETCDQLDNDCNGEVDDIDVDGDGYQTRSCGGDDCNDANGDINPGADEVPYDGLDNDCAGGDLRDVDDDGFDGTQSGGTDCDDGDPAVNPAGEEVCDDEVDNDCNGLADLDDEAVCEAAGCSCAASSLSGRSGLGLLGLLLLGLRRRRV